MDPVQAFADVQTALTDKAKTQAAEKEADAVLAAAQADDDKKKAENTAATAQYNQAKADLIVALDAAFAAAAGNPPA